jgi:hypothetical protein
MTPRAPVGGQNAPHSPPPPYRVHWTVVLVFPDPPGSRMTIGVRAGSEREAIQLVLRHRPGWAIARDEWQNPLVLRHPPVVEEGPCSR